MSSSTPEALTAAVVTVSDSCSRGERADASGPAVAELLRQHKFSVVRATMVADERDAIQKAILDCTGVAGLIVTTGGTGLAERDANRHALHHLDPVTGGVLRRQQREGAACAGRQALHLAVVDHLAAVEIAG